MTPTCLTCRDRHHQTIRVTAEEPRDLSEQAIYFDYHKKNTHKETQDLREVWEKILLTGEAIQEIKRMSLGSLKLSIQGENLSLEYIA